MSSAVVEMERLIDALGVYITNESKSDVELEQLWHEAFALHKGEPADEPI